MNEAKFYQLPGSAALSHFEGRLDGGKTLFLTHTKLGARGKYAQFVTFKTDGANERMFV